MSLSRNIARLLPNNSGRLPIQNSIVGNVIQAVITESANNWQTTSNSWVSSSIYAQITPKFINSKILVTIAGTVGSSSGPPLVAIGSNNNNSRIGQYSSFNADYNWAATSFGYCLQCLDTPNSLSLMTYNLLLAVNGSGPAITNCTAAGAAYSTTTITLLEIAG